ncbi:Putrescine aminotransferase [Nymphon striatum]|nr:Putrescine aminotransferase [Nymphon striatum]
MDSIITRLVRPEISEKIWYFPAENIEIRVANLLEKIKYYAGILQGKGVKKGDCIGLINSNSSDLVCLLYACWYANAVAVPLRTQTGKFQRLEHYIEQCDEICNFKLFIIDDDIQLEESVKDTFTNGKPVFRLTQFKKSKTTPLAKPVSIEPHDNAIIQFSSGSTGQPKGIIVNHSMMMAQLNNIEQQIMGTIGGATAECYALWAPLNHDMGMFVGALSPIHHGSNNVLAPPSYFIRNPIRWFKMMEKRKVEVAMFTNTVLAKCLPILERKTKNERIDLSRCRIYLGAEKVSPKVLKKAYPILEPLFGNRDNLYIGYGMAENGLGVSTTLTGEIPIVRVNIHEDNRVEVLPSDSLSGNEFASVGVPYPYNHVTIRNSLDEVLNELELGEINIQSNSLTPSYLNNPEITKERLSNNRFKSGDLGFWYNGQLYFHSRKDDLIISNGQNIVPDDIELMIEELDFVRASSSVLFSIEDTKTGLQKLYLLAESSANISDEEALYRKNTITSYAFNELGIILNGGTRQMNSKQQYESFCKPKLTQLFDSLGLALDFKKAKGNYLITDDGQEIVDFVSGFGSAILGHNHPELINELIENLNNSTPIVAQGSIPKETAELAEQLNQYIPGDGEYLVHFCNSGAESVEAAIKHAYKVHYDKIEKEYERLTRILDDFYFQYEKSHSDIALPDGKKLIDFRDDLDEFNLEQYESFKNKPVMISFKGAYHGKTTSSLKVTFNKSLREAFEGLSAIHNVFIDSNTPERIPEIINQEVCTFYYPAIVNGSVNKTAGLIPLPDATLQYMADNYSRLKLPFIIDEIQTGCGRLGRIFSYSDTPLASINPDYILLSKSLGGGISKIGATLIKKEIYEQDFGILHTSTFGEDKLSSKTATKVLEILTRNNNELLDQVKDKGQYLRSKLQEVQQEFPQIIKDVRGQGLMIGVEFTPLEERSPFFRAAGKQGVLSLLIASYLIHYYKIRVLAPISTMLKGNPGKKRLSTVRIQPAAIIEQHEMDLLISALREVCLIIHHNNEYCLVGHLIGANPTNKERKNSLPFPARYPMNDEYRHIDARIGFIMHPTTVEKLVEYYFPSFESYSWSKDGLTDWWNKISRFLEPVHVKNEYITSNDFIVETALVFVPYLPDYVTKAKEPFLQKEIRDKVQDAVTVARELGDDNIPVSMVGLGAYTSIATHNGETINYYEMPITTGNAYTVGLSVQGIIYAAQHRGLDISKATVAVVGAGGNIGSVMANILAPRVGKLMLVGSGNGPRSEFRLKQARKQCASEIFKEWLNLKHNNGDPTQLGKTAQTVMRKLIEKKENERTILDSTNENKTGFINQITNYLSDENSPHEFSIHTSLEQLKQADIVVVATNSADHSLIKPEHVKQNAIVCGTSVPSNLSLEFSNKPEFSSNLGFSNKNETFAFDGGFSKLPDDSRINFVGMPKDGMAYGCLAETLVLGFDGQNHSFSKGTLTSDQVYEIMEIAQTHGFDLGTLKFNDEPLEI